MKRILVVEGPAGSGKTTLIHRLSKLIPAAIIQTPWIVRPRAYEGITGEIMALTKDLSAFATALATPGDVIIDRWVLSSWVYNRIRNPFNMDIRDLRCLMKTSIEMADAAEHQLVHRGIIDGSTESCQRFLLMMPTLVQIDQRRASAGREFPYSAAEERLHYQEICDHLPSIPQVDGDESDLYLYGIVTKVFDDFDLVEEVVHDK